MYKDFNSLYSDFVSFCWEDAKYAELQEKEKAISLKIQDIRDRIWSDETESVILKRARFKAEANDYEVLLTKIFDKRIKLERTLSMSFLERLKDLSQEDLLKLTDSISSANKPIRFIGGSRSSNNSYRSWEAFVNSYHQWQNPSKQSVDIKITPKAIIIFCGILLVIAVLLKNLV